MKVFESRPDRYRLALGMLQAGGCKPIASAVQPTFGPADFAGAGGAGLRKVDGLFNFRFGLLGEAAAPVEAQSPVLFFDLQSSEGVVAGKCRLDPTASAIEEIAPSFPRIRGSPALPRAPERSGDEPS